MKRPVWLVGLFVLLVALGSACTQGSDITGAIRVLAHEDFLMPADAIAEFEDSTGLRVVVQRASDRAEVLNLLSRSDTHPVADVVIGIDTLDRERVINESLVDPYTPLRPETIDPQLRVPNDWLIPVSYLDACVNYAVSHFVQPPQDPTNTAPRLLDRFPDETTRQDEPPPTGVAVLGNPQQAERIVLPDASTDRIGLYLMVALERFFPEQVPDQDPWPQVLALMLRSGAVLTPTWEQGYFEQFGGSIAPGRSITWGAAGMPAVYAQYQPNLIHQPLEELRINIGVAPNDCVRIVNYAGIIAGTTNRRSAGLFMEFVTSPEFQFGIPDRFGSRPARSDILSTPHWRRFGVRVDAAMLDATYVGANWETWRLTWAQVVREAGKETEVIPPVVTVTLPDN